MNDTERHLIKGVLTSAVKFSTKQFNENAAELLRLHPKIADMLEPNVYQSIVNNIPIKQGFTNIRAKHKVQQTIEECEQLSDEAKQLTKETIDKILVLDDDQQQEP